MKRSLLLMLAGISLYAANCLGQAHPIDTVAKNKYVPSPVLKGFYKTPVLAERIAIYNASIAQYPDTGRSAVIGYSYARISMAVDYARAGDMKSSDQWLKLVTNHEYHDDGIARVAGELIKTGNNTYAEERLKPIVDSMYKLFVVNSRTAPKYTSFISVYVYALRNNTQPGRIVHYLQPLYEKNRKSFPSDGSGLAMSKPGAYKLTDNLLYTYATALGETGKYEEATRIFTGMSFSGTYDAPYLKDAITAAYTKLPGGLAYYSKFADSVKQVYSAKLQAFATNKKDAHGNAVNFEALKGKYVLIDFWGSWCGPCRASHPHLKELYAKYKDKGFEIVGVAEEHSTTLEQSRKLWTEAIAKDGLTWIQVLNDENIDKFDAVNQYGIVAFPTKILLDRDGKIIGRFIGNGAAGEGFTGKLAELLGK